MARRILQVIGRANRGGIETWLMHMMRNIDRSRFEVDFLVHSGLSGDYDEEIQSLGFKLLRCPDRRRLDRFSRCFLDVLRAYGPYDIVHSHIHRYSGFVLSLAKFAGVPVRIAHSHTDRSGLLRDAKLPRQLFELTGQFLIRKSATMGLAISSPSAVDLYGANWCNDKRFQLLYYGIDLEPFAQNVDSNEVRRKLGIPPGTFVVGHVGRFYEPKNHRFLIKIARHLIEQESDVYMLFVGDGPLQMEIKDLARSYGIADRCIFTGVRSDVPALMMGAMDAFLFPSLFEGLGLVLVEAQAAGLPCIMSSSLPSEAVIIPDLVDKLSLDAPVSDWVDVVIARRIHSVSKQDALQQVRDSVFSLDKSLTQLQKIYSV